MEPLLLVEDKPELRAMLRKALERAGYSVDEAADGSTAVNKIRARRYLLVLSDLKLPGCSGLEVLHESKQADPTIPVILITAFGSIEEAVAAMKDGAFDFIQKPVDLEHLNLLVARAARSRSCCEKICCCARSILRATAFRESWENIPPCRRQRSRCSGGRDRFHGPAVGRKRDRQRALCAGLHALSPRRSQPFVALNCAAIPEGLVENELFGHERGAYTGAGARKIGKMELAHRGTIFLDEIGELPIAIQSKLLRVLEEKRFDRVGGTQSTEVDVRILAATNKDLRAAVAAKMFREDLFFRIAGVPITIPPLRERGNDVLLLADAFLDRFRQGVSQAGLATDAIRRATLYSLILAGQCARTAKHHGARGHSQRRQRNRRRRSSTVRRTSLGGTNARRDAERNFLVGRHHAGGQRPGHGIVERFKIEAALRHRDGIRRARPSSSASPTRRC